MEESNLSNSQEAVHNMNNKILFLYHTEIQGLPVNMIYHNSNNIDHTIGEYDHIVIQDLCDFYSEKDISQLLLSIFHKMKEKAKLEIQGIDFKQLCIAVANEDIDGDLAKDIIYSRKHIYNIYDIQNYFKDIGLSIFSRRYINIFEYNITGIK